MKQKLISLITAITMVMTIFGAIPQGANAETTENATINLGEYVQMGEYNGTPILWRCVAFEKATRQADGSVVIDSTATNTTYQAVGDSEGDFGYLPLMLADTSICNKEFDAKGSNTENSSHGRKSGRTNYGSNYWGDSNIRDWLNSADTTVNYTCGNAPSYSEEAGFLTNLSAAEKAAINEVTQKSILNTADKEHIEGFTGTKVHSYNSTLSNAISTYSDAWSEQITDTVFLLDIQQTYNVSANTDLGDGYYKLSSELQWLRTPYAKSTNGHQALYIKPDGTVQYYYVNSLRNWNDYYGVCPAFFLNPSSAAFVSGNGNKATPYSFTAPFVFEGEGTEESPYLIPDLEALEAFRGKVNGGDTCEGQYFKMTADIDMSEKYSASTGKSWTPIGQYTNSTNTKPFKGNFDGGGNSITGLYINKADSDYQGLFGYIENAVIKNLSVSGSVSGKGYVGGICSKSSGSNSGKSVITDCVNNCAITGSGTFADAGGIVGYCTDTEITRCNNTGSINTTKGRIGGICGTAWQNVTITDCYNTAAIDGGNANYAGGIVGYIYTTGTTITRCYNTGNISGGSYIGGIVGENAKDGTVVINVYNRGNITSKKVSTVFANNKGSFVGGIFGSNINGRFHNCYNTGNVSHIEDEYETFGGIGGKGGQAYNSYYLSNETVNNDMGGIANLKGNNSTIPVDNAAFASGEIAWHLYNDFDDYYLTAEDVQAWGQTVSGDNTDTYPILTTDSAKKVYKVTFMVNGAEYAVKYANAGGVATLPTAPAPDNGYEFYKWSKTNSANGEEFMANTPITEDITVYAVQREQYDEESGEHKVETTYGTAATLDLSTCIGYGGATAEAGKFTYSIESGNDTLGASIDGDTLTVPNTASANESGYTLTIKAHEKEPQISLMSVNSLGTEDVTFDVKVIVNKATPTLIVPTTTAVTYGVKLSDITLDTGWAWVDGDTVPTVTNSGYNAQYTVSDYTNYDWSDIQGYDADTHKVTRTLAVTVNKATPAYTTPENISAFVGQKLSDVTLPEGWSWADGTQSVGEVGTHTFDAVFTPSDTDNYITVNTSISVKVDYQSGSVELKPGESIVKEDETITNNTDGTVTIDKGNDGTADITITLPESGNIPIDEDGNVNVPTGAIIEKDDTKITVTEGENVTVDKDGNITFPNGGKADIEKDGKTNSVDMTAGDKVDFGNLPTPTPTPTAEPTATPTPTPTTRPHHSSSSSRRTTPKPMETPKTTQTPTPEPTVQPTETDTPVETSKPNADWFTDVPENAWYYNSVKYVFENGLMLGVSKTEFAPEADITRAMFVTALYRMENEPDISNEILGYPFADVDANDWYGNAVYWTRLNGIVNGYSDEEFAPDESITREQMAAIIYRYAKFKGYNIELGGELSYSDNDSISDYARDAVIWNLKNGIMFGNDDNTFSPASNTTRAQAAAVFERIMKNVK